MSAPICPGQTRRSAPTINMNFKEFFTQRLQRGLARRLNNLKIAAMAKRVARHSPPSQGQPVVFFKASTGIDDLSWNSGFHLLASWALRLKGIPVAYFACNAGMSKCVLGTNRDHPQKEPPCKSCVYQSKTLYTGLRSNDFSRSGEEATEVATTWGVHWFDFQRDKELEHALENLSLGKLSIFEWVIKDQPVIASAGRVGGVLSPYRDQAKQSSRESGIAS